MYITASHMPGKQSEECSPSVVTSSEGRTPDWADLRMSTRTFVRPFSSSASPTGFGGRSSVERPDAAAAAGPGPNPNHYSSGLHHLSLHWAK